MNEYRILFTGIGRRVELIQAFRRAALCQDKKIRLYGTDMDGTAPALLFVDAARKICGMRDERYIPALLEICRKDAIHLLIPTIDTDLSVLSENRKQFEAIGTKVLISSPEMVRICRDKYITSRFFTECGLKTPLPVRDWKQYAGGYPAFIKPRDGSSSVNAFKVLNVKQLEQYASQAGHPVIQPFIRGDEYTIDIFCDFRGNPVFVTPRLRMAVRSGEVLKTKITLDARMIAENQAIIRRFKPCGPITVQMIREETTGEDYYIEINPRFGGGAPLSMKAGADSAGAILRLLSGETLTYTEGAAEDGAMYSRYDQSVCVTGKKQVRAVRGVIFDLDDTLYSEKQYIKSGCLAVAKRLGDPALAERMWELFTEGKPAVDRLLGELGRLGLKDECMGIYRGHAPKITLYEGVREMLQTLKAAGLKVGIITDGRVYGQKQKMKALGLDALIPDIIITDELGGTAFRKPDDIAFRIMQRRWKIPFEQIAYVGDNPEKDFQAPGQLGMQWIYFRNPDGLYSADLDGGIEEITDVLKIIETARGQNQRRDDDKSG